MTLFSPTTVLVGFLLLYLSSFLIFAIVRIATGISIQRIGYFSLRRIAYVPKEGVQIELRGLGLSLHPPSFAQPTWLSLRLTELKVTVDPAALAKGKRSSNHPDGPESPNPGDCSPPEDEDNASFQGRSKTWRSLTKLKEQVKRLHRKIHWLKLVDVVAVNTTVHFVEAGQIQVGSLSLAVDTRRKMVDRGKLFRRKKHESGEQRPAEWIMMVQNVLLTVDGGEPTELLDNIGVNVHGILHKDLEGLRDASIALKIGRMHIPSDDLMTLAQRIKKFRQSFSEASKNEADDEVSFADFVEELDKPGSQDDALVQTVADSKEFASSLLRGIQEIQIALSFFRLSRAIQPPSPKQSSVYLNIISHEIGIDLHRMDQTSPAHRMYFQRNDIAHQALLAAISLSVSLDDSSGETDNILYIPMATTTIKTTLPSKTISSFSEWNPEERNTNILFANLVVTSPSIDLEPRHVSRLLGLVQHRASSTRGKKRNNHRLISRLLPKASIKLSVHEPVLRFVLPISQAPGTSVEDYSLLICSISSISLDIESSHSSEGGVHYSLSSIYRVASHQLYYQTPLGVKHNLLTTENLELKILLSASPQVCVIASGSLNTCSAHMVNGEVNRGIQQVIEQFSAQVKPKKRVSMSLEERKPSLLRRLPPWLLRFQFEATGLSLEIAGVDELVSEVSRGVSLQLHSWTADYRAQKTEQPNVSIVRRRTPSHSTIGNESPFRFPPTSPPRQTQRGAADGRRLALHVRGFEGFVIESEDYLEAEPFFSLPRFEVALSTLSDRLGPIFHINSVVKGIYLQYSLYRYYCVGVAVSVIQHAFFQRAPEIANQTPSPWSPSPSSPRPFSQRSELVTVDVRVTVIQVKTFLPADPPMLLQVYGLTAGSHRLSVPFIRAHLVRLHAEAPKLKGVWARIIGMNNVRVDLRTAKLKQGASVTEEKSIDVWADFIRVGVPHHMVMHCIFDNVINTSKALKQLHHRFKNRTAEFDSEREPEEPKQVPRISLRSKALLFEMEDDAFEWKLGCIYRAGLMEQRQRLAREEAYELKVQKIKDCDQRRTTSRLRAKSSHRTLRSDRVSGESKRSKSADGRPQSSEEDDDMRGRGRKFRYCTDGAACLSSDSKISAEVAWYRLQEYNARSWKKKIDGALRFQGTSIKEVRNLFSGADEPPEDVEETETILSIPNRPALMAALISDINLVIDKPSFPLEDYPTFLHRIGKGMPMSTQYALLIPMSFQLDMGEARVNLRDYPLDLLHIPALRPGQSPRLPSWSLRTNFVIAEEYRDHKSARQVQVELVPPSELPDGSKGPPFEMSVWRSVSPVKTYSDPTIEINTSLPTSISWGMSYQPVIQDMMKIIEGFTKPEIDPSDRVGFWDKVRLSFHSRLKIVWNEDGDVHLRLKGSRDPYVVTGFGSGFVMCWRKDVKWEVHTSDDPKEFMSVTSGEYVLAVPDYSHEARFMAESTAQDLESISSSSELKNAAHFKKVVMKLSGEVKWVVGLVFERNVDEDKRSFQFRPHYEVVLQNPKYVDSSEREVYDAYRGFRSNHIHLSISVLAPESRDWAVDCSQSTSYNTVHLTPRFFTHFFNWWSLFSGVMSLPVRQGPLWPGITKTSKKFNRHLATVKYKLLFAPLFVAHIYKHKDREDYGEDVVTATGLKVRLDSLQLDVHQRREQVKTLAKGRLKQTQASAMRINQAELDLQAADFRAVSASIQGTNLDDIEQTKDDIISTFQQPVPSVDLSRFTIPDHNLDWIDMDDFVELDWILPQESNPRTQILPLGFTSRFTYFRQTDHGDISPDESGYSAFGNEPTHECVMSESNEPRRVQMELIRERLVHIEAQIQDWERTIVEQELRMAKDVDRDPNLQTEHENYVKQAQSLARRRAFLASALQSLERQLAREERNSTKTAPENIAADVTNGLGTDAESSHEGKDADMDGLYSSPHDEFATNFNNRFIIHNSQLKWNNSLRNIILRYSHQVSQRRGFVYYMSRRAVKFILDIVDEQSKNQRRHSKLFKCASRRPSDARGLVDNEEDGSVEDRIEQLLNDAKRFVNAEEQEEPDQKNQPDTESDDSSENISPEFTPQNSYHLRLIAPQIQLQSEKNQKSVVLVAAKGMQLKVVSIMDKERVSDDVSGLVQRRFSLEMDGAQFFVATQKNLMKHLQFYAGNKYGNSPGSAWPPWLTIEAMFDFELNPFGFSRIVQKTSASLRYDKYNNLRLKYNEDVEKGQSDQDHGPAAEESRIDQISVEFPHFRAICDSAEYYSMYIIVLDLLLYSDPLEKVRNERLERIMLSSDFSDLRGAPEMVFKLQSRIRHLEEIKEHFQINAKYLDKQGWEDRLVLEKDLSRCEDELFFLMKAITTSQRRIDPTMSRAHGVMRWNISANEVVWHLMKDESEPLVEFQLRNAEYDRTDNSDGSNHNLVAVERLYGLNLLPDAIYPQIIVPYLDQGKLLDSPDDHMIRVNWHMLEAVAGIPVVDDFEVSLFPLKIQLEHELGQKVFEYIFPNVGPSAFENGGFSPMMIKNMKPVEDADEDEEVESPLPPRSAHGNSDASTDDLQKGPGAIELRLQPTLTSSEETRPRSARSNHLKGLAMTPLHKDSNRLGPAESSRQTARPSTSGGLSTKRSADSLRMLSKQSADKTPANGSSISVGEDKGKKFKLPNKSPKSKAATDELSQMMSRASNYMTLAHVKVHDVVLCLSYKGKGDHNLEDIHDFVFRLPVLEYRNKTWSNLDLALRLKKDVIKALISHAPAILGNKFSHHRPTKQQQKKFREIGSPPRLLHNADSAAITISDKSQTSQDSNSEYSESQSQRSIHSGSSRHVRSNSLGSSMLSVEHGGLVSDARSASEVDVDARWEQSRRIVYPPSRPMTSGTGAARSEAKRWDGADESPKMTIRSFGRKLMPSRK
ncbi:mitochondrial protein from FMP27-domain-containing protein [Aspergillus coremiiformis]|uniref:Mitochondrial protein from FMP27-domain-containing protein n=1 Tax=Aspergillus coremiiformis TaxID=138285 RepID=A0A5N6Z7G5_9EURO|nr:mitochondrial protein from FMP27-domain-containing protein [Aspergillus coremiiformis]